MDMSGSSKGQGQSLWFLRSLAFKHLLYDLFAWCGGHGGRALLILGIYIGTGGY
jgi:hypothetical protein